jgi:hypothetical protein
VIVLVSFTGVILNCSASPTGVSLAKYVWVGVQASVRKRVDTNVQVQLLQ